MGLTISSQILIRKKSYAYAPQWAKLHRFAVPIGHAPPSLCIFTFTHLHPRSDTNKYYSGDDDSYKDVTIRTTEVR